MSAIQGLLKYRSELKDSQDFQNIIVHYILGVCYSGVFVKQGSTVYLKMLDILCCRCS